MSAKLGPIMREEFIRRLRALGFTGPYAGRRHSFMAYGDYSLHIPSYSEYDVSKHREMIREVETIVGRTIPREEWNRL